MCSFTQLSDEVHGSVLACLHGYEAALFVRALPCLRRITSEPHFWRACIRREFKVPLSSVRDDPLQAYRTWRRRSLCLTLRWARCPCQHQFGGRGDAPAIFCCRGYVFIFGGGNRGPKNDLHVGRLVVPLVLRPVQIVGKWPFVGYNCALSVLDEETPGNEAGCSNADSRRLVRVAVTGGGLPNGRWSDQYGIFALHFLPAGGVHAEWVTTGRMPTPRSGHRSVFVPPRCAGPLAPSGCLLLIGGNYDEVEVTCVWQLDLDTLSWHTHVVQDPHHAQVCRFGHTATLARQRFTEGVLVVGGPAGRAGDASAWLEGLQGPCADWTWTAATRGVERCVAGGEHGHAACRVGGTHGSVLLFGSNAVGAFVDGRYRRVEVLGQPRPEARTASGVCALSDGTILFCGGRSGSRVFDDIWVAHTGAKTAFFSQVQRELSFLCKMQRRVNSLRQTEVNSSEDEYPETILESRRAANLAEDLLADFESDQERGTGAGHEESSDESDA